MADRSARRSCLKGSRIAPVHHEPRAPRSTRPCQDPAYPAQQALKRGSDARSVARPRRVPRVPPSSRSASLSNAVEVLLTLVAVVALLVPLTLTGKIFEMNKATYVSVATSAIDNVLSDAVGGSDGDEEDQASTE